MKQLTIKEIRRGLTNQAGGLLPLLLFMFLNNYFPYLLSFSIGVIFCFFSYLLFYGLYRGRVYQFMLLPSAITLVLYSLFLFSKLEPMLYLYSALITELLLVVVLSLVSFFRRLIMKRIKEHQAGKTNRSPLRNALGEFFYIAQIVQNIYTLHLFAILLYIILPETMHSMTIERFLFRQLGVAIGITIIVYEQIRLYMMKRQLHQETWIPVLDDRGKVIGRVAKSVSLRRKNQIYRHPVVRVALLYRNMLYLVKRDESELVSPGVLDFPFHQYVQFHQTIDQAVAETIGADRLKEISKPRFLIRYSFRNEKVNQQISLYVICTQNEEQFNACKPEGGKLWTSKQIEDNLEHGVFSEYFEKEYPYMQSTILLAEQYCCKGI
ncbi:hypothetical protein [Parabacteroides sp. Marseille-P3160]|uniref:hypothetical protein n=1 Tax=Parabacteroides sp. Marseille-P3160 TaxID=1917887 RepID=UPI0009BC4180|nr:hypothetical protein [Parabacteroides sp. Marseille-P3160]